MQFYTLNNVNYNTIDTIQTQNKNLAVHKNYTIITPENMILTQQKLKNNQVLTFRQLYL